jgi:hypothetical protein
MPRFLLSKPPKPHICQEHRNVFAETWQFTIPYEWRLNQNIICKWLIFNCQVLLHTGVSNSVNNRKSSNSFGYPMYNRVISCYILANTSHLRVVRWSYIQANLPVCMTYIKIIFYSHSFDSFNMLHPCFIAQVTNIFQYCRYLNTPCYSPIVILIF